MERLKAALDDTGNATAREGALLAIKGLLVSVARAAEPYVVPLIPTILDRAADKVAPVRWVTGQRIRWHLSGGLQCGPTACMMMTQGYFPLDHDISPCAPTSSYSLIQPQGCSCRRSHCGRVNPLPVCGAKCHAGTLRWVLEEMLRTMVNNAT